MLLNKINENNKDKYDFFYLPIDFKVKINFNHIIICLPNFIEQMQCRLRIYQLRRLNFHH